MAAKFIQTIPYYAGSYTLPHKEDYMALAPTGMAELGYQCECVILKPKGYSLEYDKIRKSLRKDIKIKIFESFYRYFTYLIRQKNALVFAHDRTPSALICSLFGKRNVFMSHQSTLPRKWWQRMVFGFFARRFDGIRVVNPFEKNELVKLGVNPKKVEVIPHVIDFDFFSQKVSESDKEKLRKKYKVSKRDECFAFLAHVRGFKNVDIALSALKIVAKTHPKAKLLIIGKDKLHEEGQPSVMEKAAKLGIKKNVIITGFVEHKDVVKLLNICSIGLNTSFHEGQCLAVYEMACAGLPLCLSSIGSFTSVFKDSALFHNVQDSKKLAENILRYIDNPEIANMHVSANKKLIGKNYTYDHVKRRLCKFIIGAK